RRRVLSRPRGIVGPGPPCQNRGRRRRSTPEQHGGRPPMTVLNDLSVADRYRAVAADFTRLLAGVADWEAPTPVQEWDVREIVRHLVDWLPGLLAAGSPIQLAA